MPSHTFHSQPRQPVDGVLHGWGRCRNETEGLIGSILHPLGFAVPGLDHSTIARREFSSRISRFTETPGSQARERRPTLLIHPDDAAGQGLAEGDGVELTNRRGAVILRVRLFDGVRRGVVIAESIWPNAAHQGGRGINTLTGADPVAPFGGAAVHDSHVRLRRCAD